MTKKRSKIIVTLPNTVDNRAIDAAEKIFGGPIREPPNVKRPGKRKK